jgi:hypothetical protein
MRIGSFAGAAVAGLGIVLTAAARGEYATIPGGFKNAAAGIGSFAAGTLADARTNGAFVWSDDSSASQLHSNEPYQFLARASGGFLLYSNAAATSGVELKPNAGAWGNLSDRTLKTGVVPLDDRHITTIDEDGIALAAIKALHAENAGLHAENASLRDRLAALERRVDALVARVSAVSAR